MGSGSGAFLIRLTHGDRRIRIPARARAPVQTDGAALRRGRGRSLHARRLSARACRSGRLAGARLPAGRAGRLDRMGGGPRDRHGRRQRGRLQLLSPSSCRAFHDPGRQQLGRARSIRRRGRFRLLAGRADPGTDPGCAGAPPGGRPRGRDGSPAAAGGEPHRVAADSRRPPRRVARAELRRDRDGRRRGR